MFVRFSLEEKNEWESGLSEIQFTFIEQEWIHVTHFCLQKLCQT